MKFRVQGITRFVLVSVGIVVLTSLSIDATDTFRGSQSALSILADRATQTGCPSGMVQVADYAFCVDTYELSAGEDCDIKNPRSQIESSKNLNDADCVPQSKKGIEPWTNVALAQARALCARVGKRLPEVTEWYQAALATPDGARTCNTDGPLQKTGSFEECRSGAGALDMIGNVWELVEGEVENGQYQEDAMPAEGYVETIYESGLARTTTSSPQSVHNDDYFWSELEGVYAIMRGGFHGSHEDAGVYSTHAAIAQNFSSGAIGFRCVISL